MKSFDKLPEQFQCEEVKAYYDILCKKTASLVFKRIVDIVAAFILLIILILPIVVISIIIKCTSKGKVFFRQERVTTYGKIFKIYKFRTMIENADELGTLVTTDSDNRVTKIGKILRKYHLDEIPQLLCILEGSMSFVGPRPERECFYIEFEKYIHGFSQRLKVKPGLTGFAQIRRWKIGHVLVNMRY